MLSWPRLLVRESRLTFGKTTYLRTTTLGPSIGSNHMIYPVNVRVQSRNEVKATARLVSSNKASLRRLITTNPQWLSLFLTGAIGPIIIPKMKCLSGGSTSSWFWSRFANIAKCGSEICQWPPNISPLFCFRKRAMQVREMCPTN